MKYILHLLLVVWAAFASAAEAELQITTFAGTGEKGFSGDGRRATRATLNQPFGIVRGPDGALYICDTGNHAIRRVDPNGTITTVAGCGRKGYSGDGGLATKAELAEPYEIRFDRAGHLFFVEMQNNLVRRVDAKTRLISTVAGTGAAGFSGDGGPATKAELKMPHSLQFGPDGSLYIADIGNGRIRKVEMRTGVITTFTPGRSKSDSSRPIVARTIDFDADGDMWITRGNQVCKIDMKTGSVDVIAGAGKSGFTGNGGPATEATLSGPKGLAVGPDGNIYLADSESHSVRMIDLKTGKLELVAGTGEPGDGPEGDPLTCKMDRLHGIFVDRDGAIYIGDTNTHRVRVIRKSR